MKLYFKNKACKVFMKSNKDISIFLKVEDIKIPKLYIDGNLSSISKENEKLVTLKLLDKNNETVIDKYAMLSYQGDSSLNYPKKNYKFDMYTTEECVKSYKHKFTKDWTYSKTDWPSQDNFHLKANYIDPSHARNIINCQLVRECWRDGGMPNGSLGTIDGFPVILYINNIKKGLYTINLPQKKGIFGMSDKTGKELMYRGIDHDTTARFGLLSCNNKDVVLSDFEERYPKTYTDENRAKLNKLIEWVRSSTDNEFRDELNQYFDKNTLLVYYIILLVTAAIDNVDQHVTLATYDSGSKWYVTHYDLDGTWGMHCSYNYGDISPTCKFPDGYVGQTEGILWGKVKRALKDDIKELYSSLRTDVLTYENIYKKFTDFFKMIPQKEYDDDKIINPGIYKTDTKESIQNWIKQRLEYIDDFILNDATEVLPHEFAYGYLNNSITEFALYDNEEIWIPIKYWATDATKVNIKFESEDTSILQTDHHVLKGVAPGETRILGICEDKPTVTKNLKVKVVPHIFYENDNIIKDRLKFWLDARDFNMEDNTILDRTGLNKIIVNGNPTKINNTLIFDGEDDYLKINYLGYKLKYSKIYTVEIFYNDDDETINNTTLLSMGAKGNISLKTSTVFCGYKNVYNKSKELTRTYGINKRAVIIADGKGYTNIVDGETSYLEFSSTEFISVLNICYKSSTAGYKGKINSIRIYDKALTLEELEQNLIYENSIDRN